MFFGRKYQGRKVFFHADLKRFKQIQTDSNRLLFKNKICHNLQNLREKKSFLILLICGKRKKGTKKKTLRLCAFVAMNL